MAVEARPSTATLSLENYTVARAASVANAPAGLDREHRVANLLSPLRGDTWRIPSGPASVDIDLGTARTPGAAGGIRVFALVNYNGFPGGFTVTLSSITGLGGSVVSTWSYTTYAPASVNRLVRWFVGNHDGGAAGAASRYWRIGLPYSFGLGADRPGPEALVRRGPGLTSLLALLSLPANATQDGMTKTPAAADVRRRARALAVRRLVQRRNAELRRLARRVEIEPRER